ncbi:MULTISPECIES: hypothetical protein [unclassified Nocardioides]|uniref:hypothetical protein n=1 Tax=unclassified Nocardioides TaxID=2615069 RepID=UPI003014697F
MRRFFARPAAWKALVLVVAYLVLYLAVGQVVGLLFGDEIDTDDILGTTGSIFFGLVLPIAIGATSLVGLSAALGWLRALFGRQPGRGRPWMWIGPGCGSARSWSSAPSSVTWARPTGTCGRPRRSC